jgi:diguanylate cyclase (GGDEF)-like protein
VIDLGRGARAYVTVVRIIGFVALLLAVFTAHPTDKWAFVGLLTLATIAGEVRPILVPLGSEGMAVTVSTAFGFALVLEFGIAYGAVALVVATIVADVMAHKEPWKIAFNASQYVLSAATAGLVVLAVNPDHYRALSESDMFAQPRDLLAALGGAVAFLLSNLVILGVALSLAQRVSVTRVLQRSFRDHLIANSALLALSPITVVVGQRSVLLLPCLAVPLIAAYRTALLSQEKEHQSLHDSLTGLANRSYFRARIDEALREAAPGKKTAVMMVDLDRFKEINDTLGHSTGDRVLRQLGPRLRDALGPDDLVARLGGDEFGVVLPSISDAEEASVAAAALLDAIRQPIEMGDASLSVDASIGIALYPEHGPGADILIQRADIVMYAAKDDNAGFLHYSPTFDQTSPMRLMLVRELRDAIAEDTLAVYFQPKVNVQTGLPVGAEALVRWNHPTRGLVPPDEFIPIAEQTGLIKDLTRFVLRRAVEAAREWADRGLRLSVSVNVSAKTLHDPELASLITELLATYDVDPSLLVVEITESTIMTDVAGSTEQLERLRTLGVEISLDDYGTGHSSLAHIKNLPIDELKIDKSFILTMTEGSSDALIAASTVDLGKRLGLRVVAEGVETARAWRMLQEMGCELAQGYHFCRPVPPSEFLAWVARHGQHTAVAVNEPTMAVGTKDSADAASAGDAAEVAAVLPGGITPSTAMQ